MVPFQLKKHNMVQMIDGVGRDRKKLGQLSELGGVQGFL
jgi:hypothetical protein